MTKHKKIIVFAIGVLLMLSIVFMLFRPKKPRDLPALPTPNIPKLYKEDVPINQIRGDFSLPSTASVYQVSLLKLTKDYASEVAGNLDFVNPVNETRDYKDGIKYFVTDNSRSLWITPSKSLVSYELNSFPIALRSEELSDIATTDLAERFIKEKLLVKTDNLKFSKSEYYKKPPGSDESGFVSGSADDFDFVRISFTLKDLEYPLLTPVPIWPAIFVDILKNGEVYKANVIPIESYKNIESRNIKDLTDINSTLNQSTLLELSGVYISIPEVKSSDLKEINIDKIDVVYLIDGNFSGVVQPVFSLEGDVQLINTTADRAKLLLPAIK